MNHISLCTEYEKCVRYVIELALCSTNGTWIYSLYSQAMSCSFGLIDILVLQQITELLYCVKDRNKLAYEIA